MLLQPTPEIAGFLPRVALPHPNHTHMCAPKRRHTHTHAQTCACTHTHTPKHRCAHTHAHSAPSCFWLQAWGMQRRAPGCLSRSTLAQLHCVRGSVPSLTGWLTVQSFGPRDFLSIGQERAVTAEKQKSLLKFPSIPASILLVRV